MATDIDEWFRSNLLSNGLYSALAGERLGEGIHRVVHRCRIDPEMVIKFEVGKGTFSNVMEWEVWQTCKDDKPIAKWFAPCVSISDNGAVLVQRYAADIPKTKFPKKIPKYMSDLKEANWGLYKGHPVARDYANNLLICNGLIGAPLKKAEFWT